MTATPQPEKHVTPADEDMARLLERTEKGDLTVLPQLRRLLDESPELWRGYGDLSLQAQGALGKLYSKRMNLAQLPIAVAAHNV